MTYSIVFTKRFTSGNLEGLTSSPQFLSFPSQQSRLNWIKDVKANQAKGFLNWAFESETFWYTDFSRQEAIDDYNLWAC